MCRWCARLCGTALVGLFAAMAAAQAGNTSPIIYSPWSKICLSDTCFVGADAHTECGLVASAVVIEKKTEAKKTLRVMLPKTVNTAHGVRIAFDQATPVSLPFAGCTRFGCNADYAAEAELIDRLKHGRTLVIDGVDAADAQIGASLPLADFAATYDGPPQQPKLFEVKSYAEIQAAEERQKRAEAERKLRCEGKE
jgi:invasion protein IalB